MCRISDTSWSEFRASFTKTSSTFNQTSPPLDSTEQKRLTLELGNLYCRGKGRLTSVERPPALYNVRSSHWAASWSPNWAAGEGLPESWLSTPSCWESKAVTAPLEVRRVIPRGAAAVEQNEAVVYRRFTPDGRPRCSDRTRLWLSLSFWHWTRWGAAVHVSAETNQQTSPQPMMKASKTHHWQKSVDAKMHSTHSLPFSWIFACQLERMTLLKCLISSNSTPLRDPPR